MRIIKSIDSFIQKHGFLPLYEYKYSFKRFLYNFPPGKWWFLYRFHPKHAYDIVNLKLKPGYYDSNVRMFYAIFRIFEEHIEEAKNYTGGYDYIIGDDPDFDQYVSKREACEYKDWYLENRATYEDFYQAWHWWLKIGKNFESYQENLCYDKEKGTWDGVIEEKLNLESDAMILKIVTHIRTLWT